MIWFSSSMSTRARGYPVCFYLLPFSKDAYNGADVSAYEPVHIALLYLGMFFFQASGDLVHILRAAYALIEVW